MERNKPRLGFIGSMIGNKKGKSAPMGQIIADLFDKEGFQVVNSSNKLNKLLRLFDIMWALCSRHKKIDILIIQVYSGLSFVIVDMASWLGKVLKMPMIFHVHGGCIPSFMEKHLSWTKRVFNRADFIVTPSHYLANPLVQYGFDVTLIPNVIDLSMYKFVHRRDVEPKIVWVRAFHNIYNPSLAPRVLLVLKNMGIIAELMMIGPDKGDGSFQETIALADKLGISERLHLPGGIAKQDVPSWIRRGDIFINTTNIDNTPVSILEAMACGLCIVSTKVGGIPYLLEDGKDALLVPPDDPKAMAFAIRRILTEPNLAEKLSMNARQKAEQFDWSVVLPQWEKLFLEIVNDK